LSGVSVLLDALLPQRCLGCGALGPTVCGGCVLRLPRLEGPCCERCGSPTQYPVRRCVECAGRRLAFAQARSALAYEGTARKLVAAWKERGLRRLATLAADVVVEVLDRPGVAVLVFVPPDRDRSLRRGHHPAERLAHELGARWSLPVEPLLRRQGGSRPQRGLALSDRRRNVRGAFVATGRSPPKVALVDDVYTSGATAAAAASALRKVGARRVEVVTLARAMR
jgi:ComF family protein